MFRKQRILLNFLGMMVLLLSLPVMMTWRGVRQERLNRALMVEVWRNNTPAVRRLLHQGADPNIPLMPGDTISAFDLRPGNPTTPNPIVLATNPRSWWQHFIDRLHTQPIHHSALMEAIEYPINP